VNEISELKRQGLSIQAISAMTGFDRKTVRKYLLKPDGTPAYGPRPPLPSKLDKFKPYLEERLKAGVWNAVVLLRELKERGYSGGYTILTDWLRPQRTAAQVTAVRRFEAPPGRQALAQLQTIVDRDLPGEIRRDFAVRQPFDCYLNATFVIRGEGDRVGTDRGVSIRGG
jgi:transposase